MIIKVGKEHIGRKILHNGSIWTITKVEDKKVHFSNEFTYLVVSEGWFNVMFFDNDCLQRTIDMIDEHARKHKLSDAHKGHLNPEYFYLVE